MEAEAEKRRATILEAEQRARTQQLVGDAFGVVDTLVRIPVLNPKALTLKNLYGDFDPVTSKWTDGIASAIIREECSAKVMILAASSEIIPAVAANACRLFPV